MFGSEVVDAFVHAELATLPAVTAAVGTRIASIEIVPATMALPAGLRQPVPGRHILAVHIVREVRYGTDGLLQARPGDGAAHWFPTS